VQFKWREIVNFANWNIVCCTKDVRHVKIMDVKKDENNQDKEKEEFRVHEQLKVASREIESLYHPADIKVYRTFVSKPPIDIDIQPQALRESEGGIVESGLSQEEYDALKPKKKVEYMSKRSLSVNETKEAAIASAVKTYKSVASRFGEEAADFFMENDRGTYVGGIVLKPHQAKITNFKGGHAEVILSQDVKPEDIEIFEELTKYEYKEE